MIPSNETQLKWIKNLIDRRNRGCVRNEVACYSVLDKDGNSIYTCLSDICHRSLYSVSSGSAYVVNTNQCGRGRQDHSEWYDSWLDYLFSESPFRFAIVSPREFADKGMIVRTDIPGNYMLGAIQSYRQGWESRSNGTARLFDEFWLDLLDAGIHPTVAAVLIAMLSRHGNRFVISQGHVGHWPFNPRVTIEEIHRLIKFDINHPNWSCPSPCFNTNPKGYLSNWCQDLWRGVSQEISLHDKLEEMAKQEFEYIEHKSSFGTIYSTIEPCTQEQILNILIQCAKENFS